MAQPRHLTHAPITEAVIDLRCQLDTNFDLERLRELEGEVGYDTPKEMSLFEFGVRQEAGMDPQRHEVHHGAIGLRFTSPEGTQVLQFRKDGFTFSRLAPYTNWEEVFAEATRLYRLYLSAANPQEVARPAVRYINRMLFPEAEVGDFSAFLTAPPAFPRGEKVFLTGFFSRIQVQEPDSLISATITQTVQQSAGESGTVAVILDIDVYEPRNFEPAPDAVLPRFAALREAKNRYFFASITERAAELFQ